MLTMEELRKASGKTLAEELAHARREHTKLSIGVKTGQSKAIHELRNLRRYIARLQTVQNNLSPSCAQKKE